MLDVLLLLTGFVLLVAGGELLVRGSVAIAERLGVSPLVIGIVLAIGRCAEDTAVIMLTGVVATAGVPKSLFSPFEALPFFIYYTACEYSDPSELDAAYGAALILLGICAGLFIISFQIKRRYNSTH